MISLNQLLRQIRAVANAHSQINTYAEGQKYDFSASNAIVYPCLWVVPMGATNDLAGKKIDYRFTLVMMDIEQSGGENQIEILSDTALMLTDIVAQLENTSNATQEWQVGTLGNYEPFVDSFLDTVSGHSCELTLSTYYASDTCTDILEGYNPPYNTEVEDSQSGQRTVRWGNITGTLSDQTDLQDALNLKVDKVSGKGLSTEDYTTTEKSKLAGIQSGAEVNVNADWNSTSGDAQILNKPTIPSISGLATITYVDSQDSTKVDKVSGKGLSTEDYTSGEKTKLSGIQTGAEVNVNADWNATSGDAEILNKPTIPSIAGLETTSNKSTSVTTDQASNTKYPSVKSVYDWVIGLGYLLASTASSTYQTLANIRTSWQVTPDNIHYPSEKLVKDSLDAKQGSLTLTTTGTSGASTLVGSTLNIPQYSGGGGGGSGTVTSVAVTVPSGLSVSGSPITSAGTIGITGAGTTAQYLDGTGALQTFPTLASADKMVTIGRNSTGSTLYKGTVVYISGSTGNRPNFVKSQANAESTSAGTFGIVMADIANNADGNVVTIGTIETLDTRSGATHPFTSDTLADGDTIYLSPTTAGYITNVKPSAPNHIVYVGKVVRTSPTNGTIVYRIQNGYELDEIHDVSIVSKTDRDLLMYESSTTLWKNKTLVKGDVGLGNVDNTSDVNKPVSTATQTALNLKVDGNSAITGATKTKITYDSKGLVTAGADATTSDIADSTNKRYITDANLVVIGNTSGTNSGDNAVNSNYSGLATSKEDTSNKVTTFTGNETSTTKFPVVKAIIDYFTASNIKTILGITTLSGSNTGDQDLSGYQLTSAEDASGGYVGLTLFKINFKNVLNTFTSYFTNSNTASRTYTFQDRNGTIADDTDLGTKQDTLVSGTNIKTINSNSILGSGNILISSAVAWGAVTGTLSSQTDLQTALDNKVDENTAITGATKTKITYDSKGLVTAGADATTADIADSTNKRYVTDAQLVIVGNTSGTNTGDNSANSLYSGLATSKQDTLVSGTNIKTINSTSLLGSSDISLPTTSSTDTFTNKRITSRVSGITSSATPSVNTDSFDAVTITALALAITGVTVTGTPTDFQRLIFRIKDNGTARAITWGASFEAKGVALPTTTVISKVLTVGFIYDSVSTKWGCVASAQQA